MVAPRGCVVDAAETDRRRRRQCLTVGLGHTLELVLLLDGVAVAGPLGGVDQLVSQALGHGLDVTERGLTGSGAQQPDSLHNQSVRQSNIQKLNQMIRQSDSQ